MTLQERFHVNGEPRDAELADMDGDGWLDVVTVIRDADKVQAYRNVQGVLHLAAEIPVGTSPRELTTADFNGDGCPDFAVVNRQSFDVSILLGCGGGAVGFQTLNQVVPVDGEVSGLQLVDLNDDGRADVVQTHRASSDVSVRLTQAGGGLSAPVFYPAGLSVNQMELADVTGDDRRDLITAALGLEDTPGAVTVRQGLPGGTFGAAVQAPLPDPVSQPEARLLAVKAADFDNDGKADLALSFTDARLAFLRGNGDGTFTAAANYSGGFPLFVFAVRQMVTGDFDNDGDTDLAGAGFYGELGVLTNTGTLLTATTLAPATYSAAVLDPQLWYRARELRLEELNGDGDPDLVIGLDAGVAVFTGAAGTTFTPGQFSPGPGLPALPGARFAVNGFAFGDYDGDGDRDLAVSCMADKCLTILARQPGTMLFTEALRVRVPSAEFVASADMDGDGRADLAGSGGAALWRALSALPAVPQPAGPLNFARPRATGVVLNEIMSSNSSTPLPVSSDRFSDWVELYNPLPAPVSLAGWQLEANEEGNISSFTFPADATLGADSRLLVLCSSASVPGFHRTGWRLSGDGGTLTLKRADLSTADAATWPAQQPNVSFGRYGDGVLSWTNSNMASPGAANVYTGSIRPTLQFQGFDVENFTPGTPINLFASASDDVAVIGVSLSWRRLDIAGAAWQRALFYDDGRHGDGALGDGFFAGGIPDGLPATAQIEFYLEATDTSGLTVYDPVAPSASEDAGAPSFYTLAFSPDPAPVSIAEAVTSNTGWWHDGSGGSPDYVEILNHTTAAVALEPFGLLDSGLTASERFRFPSGAVLPPGARVLVLCSGTAGVPWHADFKLNSGGDTVYLQRLTAGGSWLTVEKVVVPVLLPLQAWARATPADAFAALPPTPGRENRTTAGSAMSWLTRPGPAADAVMYLVFPTRTAIPWTIEVADSPAGPWLIHPPATGIGTGTDASFFLPVPAATSRKFFRARY